MNRSIAVNEILRYTKPRGIDRLTHSFRNYWSIQRDPSDPDAPNILQEAGINAPASIPGLEGPRVPVLSVRSTPAKAGSQWTPWTDEYRMAEGRIIYHGDHRVTTSVPLGETAGNKRLLDVWAMHRSTSRRVRLAASPVLAFRTTTVRTQQGSHEKGFIEFCGLVVIEDLVEVAAGDPTTGREFPNYEAHLAVVSLGSGDRFDWRWIDDRRRPFLGLEETLRHAPEAWRHWIDEGSDALEQIRRREAEAG